MGEFSFLDCCDNQQIKSRQLRDVYVLIPKQYGGGHIVDHYYDGYGHFAGQDIFELVALWNKPWVSPAMLKYEGFAPKIEDYGLEPWEIRSLRRRGFDESEITAFYLYKQHDRYKTALSAYNEAVQQLEDFKSLSDEEMCQKYGDEYLLDIGCSIAGSDSRIPFLVYPIKITYNPDAVYEDCNASLRDPEQGR